MKSTQNTARLAGLLWLLAAITGGFGLLYSRSMVVSGDAAATVANIVAFQSLFRLAIASLLIAQLFMFCFAVTLFQLFKDVNKVLATVLFTSLTISVAMAVLNQFNNLGALLVLSPADYLRVFNPEQLNAIAMIFLRMSNYGQGLLEVFWIPYNFAFGLLIIKSKYLPKILGILLIIASVVFGINIFQKILNPQFHPVMFTRLAMSMGALSGIPTILWLLIKGVAVQPLDQPAS
jgi:uncharacterized protein DUF4386